ncbi:uncharacterized protein LOC120338739 [Styela clava]
MNVFRRLMDATPAKKVILYTKVVFRLSSPLLMFGALEMATVFVISERRWRKGSARIIDPPVWKGYTSDQIQEIIKGREKIVSCMKDLYEMKPGSAKDETVSQVFTKDCIYEDPMLRLVNKKEILSIFNHLQGTSAKSEFECFEATHYKEKIIIDTLRHSSVPRYGEESKLPPLRGNIILYLSQDGTKGQQQIKSIRDEWNYSALMQPETHNAYVFAGSFAKLMRRVCYYIIKPDKTFFNIFIILDWKSELSTFLNQNIKEFEKGQRNKEVEQRHFDESGTVVFDAGISKAK